ncbi:cell division protein ZapB [Microbulbifer marinus]|uniref:Methyltransferase domain-containing protein n=1 Tax=Microbulbifer marinus TaxID=658218 RepID=A0A1H3VV80_9GAMM|nr:cell division protein ZapB [Microbulbifer marinus]SDZ78676.1 hypothetical protein SAMN05216562_0300 [Microbulbifer marinus]
MIGNQVLELVQEQLYLSDSQPGSFVHVACGRDVKSSFFRDLKFKDVFLIDGNPEVCRHLHEEASLGENTKILQEVVSEVDGCKKFYLTNNERFDSTTDPSDLCGVFKNLKVIGVEERETVSISTLLAKVDADRKKFNVLILESIGRATVVLGSVSKERLSEYSIVGIKLNQSDSEAAKKQGSLDSLLVRRGYKLLLDDRTDFPFAFRVYVRRDELIQINALVEENRALKEENESLAQELRSLERAEVLEKTLFFEKRLDKLEQFLSEKIEGVVARLDKRLDRKLFNTALRLESSIALQNYFSSTDFTTSFQGWAISSDVAAYLIGKIEENNYDLIIEFGSGSSTALFARTASRAKSLPKEKANAANGRSSIKEVVAFEHHEHYLDKTARQLDKLGVGGCVNLVHAPLINQVIDGEEYLYYDCGTSLAEISKDYSVPSKKILVLVDGPPGNTGHCARFPAVPLVLEYLGMHQIDFVLDDYARPEEKEVVEKWKDFFERKGIDFFDEVFRCEKGVYFCRVGPQ